MKIRVRLASVIGAAAAVAAVIGCSKSSTGPSDPFAGDWSVTIARLIYTYSGSSDTGTVTPAPFTLTLAKGAAGQAPYVASWPALTWAVKYNGVNTTLTIPSSSQTDQTVTVSGDSLNVSLPGPAWIGQTCEVLLTGAFSGSTAQGGLYVVGGGCGTPGNPWASGTWSATR